MNNEEPYDLIVTPDLGFLISGRCYYEDPLNPNQYWPKAYFIKVDSNGMFEWETIVNKEATDVGGHGWNSVLSMDSICYYSSISQYYHSSNYEAAALLKMNLYGEILGIYELNEPSYFGKMTGIVFTSDSTIAASGIWGNEWNGLPPKAVMIDTLGNILYFTQLIDNEYMAQTRITFDGKLLYYTNQYDDFTEEFDAYLFKLNPQLESDTFYTYPFKYDTLCPYPIESDTITQDGCDIIVGIGEEEITKKEDEQRMELFPNPANTIINVRCSLLVARSSVFIYDLFGRKMDEITIPDGQTETQIDISYFPQGIYIAVLKSERKILNRKKFVKR